ncbi:GFA domain-containing protein [Favolaschia claudopus]|uniref:GFA domain-containing protein n=1 Tax=Favolaschia claudopus TaxID=2862362 RepID=A0AAV9ZFE4_9AGAR
MHKGSCLCGQVVCHCTDCRQTSGSAFSTSVMVKSKDLTITGPVKEYRSKVPSGNTVTRLFCGTCGSPITHLSPAYGDSQTVLTGNFLDFAEVPINMEVFVKDRWAGLSPIGGAAQVQAMP